MSRNAVLQKLVDESFGGKQTKFAKAINRSAAQVNQWLSGHRQLGGAGARHIETVLRLAPGYFDQESTRSTSCSGAEAKRGVWLHSVNTLLGEIPEKHWQDVFTMLEAFCRAVNSSPDGNDCSQNVALRGSSSEQLVPLSEYAKLQNLVQSQGIRMMDQEKELEQMHKAIYEFQCALALIQRGDKGLAGATDEKT